MSAPVFFSVSSLVSRLQEQRILYYPRLGKSYAEITRCMTEGHRATKVSVLKFLQQYEETGTPFHKPGSSQASKMMDTTTSFMPDI